jgi:hypothetical protein
VSRLAKRVISALLRQQTRQTEKIKANPRYLDTSFDAANPRAVYCVFSELSFLDVLNSRIERNETVIKTVNGFSFS